MKVILVLCLMVALVAAEGDHYDSKYDDFDVDSVITNSRLVKAYAQCFLDSGNCTPDGKNFKKWIPEAMETSCSKCTPKQKELIRKVIIALKEQFPEEWQKLVKKYDPEEKHQESINKLLSQSK